MKAISNCIHKICKVLLAADLLVVTFVLTINVILRYFFASGWAWAEELTRYLIAWATFVGASCCVAEGSDITIDSLLSLLSKKKQKYLYILTTVLCIIFIILFIYTSCLMTARAFEHGQMATSMKLPIWIVYASMPVGGSLFLFRFFEKLLDTFSSLKKGNEEGEF